MTVLGIDYKNSRIYLDKLFLATQDGGKTRFPKHFSQLVLVRDADLFKRLVDTVKIGEVIEVRIINEGTVESTYLDDFRLLEQGEK